ncbi:MAG: hypothetical protein KDC53_16335 [Saprospiraceae bacterium]|nr:hypothetical protein [Saprospiraceae bacterium]
MRLKVLPAFSGIIFIAMTLGCKTVPFAPGNYTKDYLIVGDGGGFTGLETKYFITIEGDVYKQMGQDTVLSKMESIDPKIVRQAMHSLEDLNMLAYDYQHPDNVYKFLTMHLDDRENKVVWGGSDDTVNPVITNIYQQLIKSLLTEK